MKKLKHQEYLGYTIKDAPIDKYIRSEKKSWLCRKIMEELSLLKQ